MIFSGFFDSCAFVPNARKGKPASWAKNVRRAIIFSPESEFPSGRTARLYPALSSLNMPKVHALALLFLNLSGSGNTITTLFYGAWLFPLGYLVLKRDFLPPFLGILLILDGVCLLICFFQLCLLPGYEKWTYPLYPVMFIAEFGLALWLLLKSVKDEKKPFAAPSAA
jgi:hypothetical protein